MPVKRVSSSSISTDESTPKAPKVNINDIDQLIGDEPPVPTSMPSSMPSYDYNDRRFDGVVDNRVIPDAGVPTEDVEGVLNSSKLRAAPKKRLGGYKAAGSNPPDKVLPEVGIAKL